MDWGKFERFLRYKKKKPLSESTIRKHHRTYKRLAPLLEDYTEDTLLDYIESRRHELTNTTINDYRKFFRLVDQYLNVQVSDCLNRLPEEPADFDVLTEQEVEDLIHCTQHARYVGQQVHEQRYSVLYQLLSECALRIQEALNLTWDDWQGDVLKVRSTKTNRIDDLVLSTLLQKELSSLPRTKDRIFPYYQQTVNENLKRRAQYLGIRKRVSSHTFRRTFATLAVEEGIQRDFIQQRMRHTNSSSLDKYVRKSKRHQKEVLRRHPLTRQSVTNEEKFEVYKAKLRELWDEICVSGLTAEKVEELRKVI